MGSYKDNGIEHGNYHNGFRAEVQGLGLVAVENSGSYGLRLGRAWTRLSWSWN